MPRPQRLSPQEKLIQEKVKAERVKRHKMEADLPPPDAKAYTRLEDLPPLHPDDEARLKAEFFAFAERVQTQNIENAITYYKTKICTAVKDWQEMDRHIRGLPKQPRDDDPILLNGIPSELFPEGTTTTDIWAYLTHNGDHPWQTGRFTNTPEAQHWKHIIENTLSDTLIEI